MGSLVIDLGLDRDPPCLDQPESMPVRRRRFGVAVAVVAALVLTTGSAPAPKPLTEVHIAAGLGDEIALSADRLYVIGTRLALGTAVPRIVSAYQLPAGRLLWREPLPATGQIRQIIPAPGALLVVVERDAVIETVAVDSSSGRMRWRSEYQPIGLTANGRLVFGFTELAGPYLRPERVVALEPSTGRAVWAYDVPADAWHDIAYGRTGGGPPRSVTAQPSGPVTVRDLDTGQVVAAADLDGPRSGSRWFQLAGDLLLATGLADGLDVVTAYGLPALDRRWTVTMSLAGGYVSADCGGALCFFSRIGGLRVIDPATGRTRWTDPRWQTIETVGGRLLAYAWPSPRGGATTAVLDPATGAQLLDLGRWTAVEPVDSSGQTRAVRLDPATGRAWFALIDVKALTVRVLASADGISGDCRAEQRVVICRRLDASVGVWRFS